MTHQLTDDDLKFRAELEACVYPIEAFGHRAHLRLAYVYLAGANVETACKNMRVSLRRMLAHHGVNPLKYHETVTRAWIMAVRHFMALTSQAESADDFIRQNPGLLDDRIMLSHYSAGLLFSERARAGFVAPDREPIPQYEA